MKAEKQVTTEIEMSEDTEFEKIWLYLSELLPYQRNIIFSLANSQDDPRLCSMVVLVEKTNPNKEDSFIHVFLNAQEVDQVIDALQKVRADMMNEAFI